jgi:hypothetical protein
MPSMSSENTSSRVGTLSSVKHAEGVAHHGGARHLAERADMRQAGRAIAGLEQDRRRPVAALVALDDLFRFLERPGFAVVRCGNDVGLDNE